ncbi:MAG: hypothetical protein VKP70_05785 [Cyanobacteriota bacterium]|nr:hypothetical protein [Cyanobacteriota bacterium]
MGSPLVIADLRHPGEPMATLPLRLPTEVLPRLQAQADRLKCNRTALGRALLLQGLEELEGAGGSSMNRTEDQPTR